MVVASGCGFGQPRRKPVLEVLASLHHSGGQRTPVFVHELQELGESTYDDVSCRRLADAGLADDEHEVDDWHGESHRLGLSKEHLRCERIGWMRMGERGAWADEQVRWSESVYLGRGCGIDKPGN